MSWLHTRPNRAFTAVTVMAGRVTRTYTWSGAMLAEGIHWMGNQAVYGRYEGLAIESEHLMFPTLVHPPHPGEFVDTLHAMTFGGVRRIAAVTDSMWRSAAMQRSTGSGAAASHARRAAGVSAHLSAHPAVSCDAAPVAQHH